MPIPDLFEKLPDLPTGKRVPIDAEGRADFSRTGHEEGGKYILFKELPIIQQLLQAIKHKLRGLAIRGEENDAHLYRLTQALLENTTTDLVNGVGSGMAFSMRFPALDITSVEVFGAAGSAEGLLTEDTHFAHVPKSDTGTILSGYSYAGKKLRVTYRRSGF